MSKTGTTATADDILTRDDLRASKAAAFVEDTELQLALDELLREHARVAVLRSNGTATDDDEDGHFTMLSRFRSSLRWFEAEADRARKARDALTP